MIPIAKLKQCMEMGLLFDGYLKLGLVVRQWFGFGFGFGLKVQVRVRVRAKGTG